jgi:transposase InsO family protein
MSQISPPEPIKSKPMPEYTWQYVAADLMGPIPSGEYFLVVVDYYSRYFEVEIVRNTSSKTIVERLEKIFASHSVPETVRTDNGPQFVSQAIKEFLREYSVKHITSTPYWPQANGEVVRQNRSCERWVLRLQQYQFSVKYKPGNTNIADCLSRTVPNTNTQLSDSIA